LGPHKKGILDLFDERVTSEGHSDFDVLREKISNKHEVVSKENWCVRTTLRLSTPTRINRLKQEKKG